MRKVKSILVLSTMAIFLLSGVAVADWVPADGHKMHFPQEPDPEGWDVKATNPKVLADDWLCTQSGYVTDIHLWGSWKDINGDGEGDVGQILGFSLSIYSNIPAPPYSMPGELLWTHYIESANIIISEPLTGLEGWYDPNIQYWIYPDHLKYYQYNIFLDQFLPPEELFYQEEGTIYWLAITAMVLQQEPPPYTEWGWKTSLIHFMDDGVWGDWPEPDWVPLEDPITGETLDLAFVITGEEVVGACCYPDPAGGGPNKLCVETTEDDCVNNYLGVYQGDGTVCTGMEACCLQDGTCVDADALCCLNELVGNPQGPGSSCGGFMEACCLPNGTCVMADSICCVNELGGIPQGPGTLCTIPEACCLGNGNCVMVDPLCCDEQGGTAQGAGTACTAPEGCCFPDGSCLNLDPLCCQDQGGTPQGTGNNCSGTTIACCLQGDPDCKTVDPLCCDDIGGTPSPIGAPACLGDNNQNGVDDACEEEVLIKKWEQLPDLSDFGVDVTDSRWSTPPGWPPYLLADDYLCTETGPILEIHIWGSWYHDYLPYNDDPTAVRFDLSFHEDIPAEENPYGYYSMPGELLWLCQDPPFVVNVHAEYLEEGWFEPPNWYDPPGADTVCWEYIFDLSECPPFYQKGTVDNPVIYWLDVQADPDDDDEPYPSFGWKSSTQNWNDDAAWINGIEPDLPIGSQGIPQWWELRYPDYPEPHPWAGETVDLAFALYGIEIEDRDSDGVSDGDDNCPDHPNGTLLGTCVKTKAGMIVSYRVGDPKAFITCTSDGDCTATDGTCDMSQGDCNSNGCGDVCECLMDCNNSGAGDGKVTGSDLGVLKNEYGRFNCSPSDPCYSDGNEDGKVTGSDLGLLKNEYGRFDCPACP